MEKFNLPNMETLKKILTVSKLASAYKRSDFLYKIGVDTNFAERNIDNYNDGDFVDSLINYLENTKQITIIVKICQEIEFHITSGEYNQQIKNIRKRLEISDIISKTIQLESMQEIVTQSYRLALFHKELRIDIANNLDESVEKQIIQILNLDAYKDNQYPGFSLLDYFVAYLYLILETQTRNPIISEELKKWLNTYLSQSNWQDLSKILKNKQQQVKYQKEKNKTTASCLLIVVFERNENLKLQALVIDDIQNFDINQRNNYQPLYKEELSLKLANFPQILRKIYSESITYCQNKNLNQIRIIKVFLPYKFIDSEIEPIDKIKIDENCPPHIPSDTFGKEYEIILEFSERLGNCHQVVKWESKRNQLVSEQTTLEDILLITDMSNLTELYRKLDSLLAIKFINKIEVKIMIEMLFYAGIPFGLWIRQDIPGENLGEQLNHLCQETCFRTLSTVIREQRHQAWRNNNNHHIGNHLSLLWDFNNLLPPTNLLSMS